MGDYKHDLEKIRHDFHRHPELGFQEVRTKQKLAEILRTAILMFMKVQG